MSPEAWHIMVTLPPTAALMMLSSWLYTRHEQAPMRRADELRREEERDRALRAMWRRQNEDMQQYANRRDAAARRQKKRDATEAAAATEKEPERAAVDERKTKPRSSPEQAMASEQSAAKNRRDAAAGRQQRRDSATARYVNHRQAIVDTVSAWLNRRPPAHGFSEQLARAEGAERQILMLDMSEQAVLILLHGLIDGAMLDRSAVSERLVLHESSVSRIATRAMVKIDQLQAQSTSRHLAGFRWHAPQGYWTGNAWVDDEWPLHRLTALDSPAEDKQAVLRTRSWIGFYRSQIFGSDVVGLSDKSADRAACTWFAGRSGTTTLWLPSEARPDTIEALETADVVEKLLRRLSGDERRVVSMTYGIGSAGVFSTEEIAAGLNRTPLQTRQIELTALAKLRDIIGERQTPSKYRRKQEPSFNIM